MFSPYYQGILSKIITLQYHKVILLRNDKSKIKWHSNKICLTCNRISLDEWDEILTIKQSFSNIYNMKSLKHLSFINRDSPHIYIHRNTQQELETFIIKLNRIATNIVITNNYCCEGKGVEIDVE